MTFNICAMFWMSLLIGLVLPLVNIGMKIPQQTCSVLDNPRCTCQFEGPYYHSVKCSGIEDVNSFQEMSARLSETAVILEIEMINFEFLPLSCFANSTIQTLIISNSTFNRIENFTGENGLNLHHFSLQNVKFGEETSWQQFSSMRQLRILFVHNSTIGNKIPATFSDYVSKSLEAVTISENNITEIETDSFAQLTNLTYLRISHNKLTTFSRNVLSVPTKLTNLLLDHNKIHTLPAGVFNGMPQLKWVSLSNNSISSLPQQVFSSLWKPSMYLDLRGNPIKCDCRLLWAVTSQNKPHDIIGQCTHPKRLFGRDLKNLTVSDFEC
ncbi:carboxypeptidase N subunit 2-like [Stegodyphus dumicola]|uniref:carboxypeptidase N subunit 2-like n=1 Tax=Stegodyphus dumicola TaxID=202533 RepID=UPI0015AE1B5B|nr:carboxypeptidase N subunit 2-like [Stegodyphus dumicola]